MNEQQRWQKWIRLLLALSVPPVFAVGVIGASVRARRRSGVLEPT